MARNKSLLQLLKQLRAELRSSQNAAHNASVRDTHVALLQAKQEELWEDHDWPHLRIRRDVPLSAGQRYYDFNHLIPIDRLERIDYRWGDDWQKLCFGIGSEQYTQWDSDRDERSEPVTHWRVHEDEQVEVWPIPSQNGDATSLENYIRLEGIRALRPLVAEEDKADLDDRLIVYSVAAELKAEKGADDAALALKKAMDRKNALVGNMSKIKNWSLSAPQPPEHRPYIPTVHYRDRET